MQIYQATPDYYNEYISHSKENHKYIDKHMGKNGKWIYTYERPKKSYRESVNPYVALDEAATYTRKKISEGSRNLKKTIKKAWKNSNVYKIATDKNTSKVDKVFNLYNELNGSNKHKKQRKGARSYLMKKTTDMIKKRR